MGVLTDLILAQPGDAPEISEANPSSPRWPRIDVKGIDQINLSTLWALLRGGAFDASDVGKFICVHEESDEGPWVYVVPDDLVVRLAGLRKRHRRGNGPMRWRMLLSKTSTRSYAR
jgi:hypothetical protein